MVSKRRLGASLLFLGLAFVGAFHTFLSFAFDTGLTMIGVTVTVGSLLCLAAVNVPAVFD
ncbi:hypothetical protein [Haladaptatus caseinilyticus]|uniref:hypothetical protein n=1 Tax=Haladaptatus caseinilyticus TaxID=2993314 RepID=UPI00224B8788|nr:hypothetical protein [Haladaptatus caseinilyticus]